MKKVLLAVLLVSCYYSAHAAIPLPEHPRPDFERSEWINLNGSWAFTFDRQLAESGISRNEFNDFDLQIQVPFSWGAKLSGVADGGDEGWYARSVTLPESWKGKRIFLVIGASEWDTHAWLDGKLLGNHQGGYTPFEFELTQSAKFGAPQNLFISADDKPANRLNGKQGYGNARGLWQTVYLEARGKNYIDYIRFSPNIDKSVVEVTVGLKETPTKNSQLQVHFKNKEQADFTFDLKGKTAKSTVQRFEIKLEKQHLWDLDDPYLYEIEAVLLSDKQTADKVAAYFGQRKIGAIPLTGTSYPYVALNNKPVYIQACLDQSYHPEGFYTFPSDKFMRDEILLSKRLGLNTNRIHIKVEIPRKLYWADKLGLLIMADTPNWWGAPDDNAKKDWEYCLRNQVKRDYNHPSIFCWVNFNETWGLFSKAGENNVYLPETQEWVRQMYLNTKKIDPTRLVEDNSPCNNDHVATDLNTWHRYLPGYRWKETLDEYSKNTYTGSTWNYINGNKQTQIPMLNSECGNVWGYEGSTGDVDFTWDYHIMMNEFRLHPQCAGWLYTEHHDVINEWNGYVRYDRSPKTDGLDALVPGMSLADLHSPYYIAPRGELCRDLQAGSTVEIALFASFMTDKYPGAIRLETSLIGWDALGKETSRALSSYPVPFNPYLNADIAPIKVDVPKESGIYALQLVLKNATGKVLGRNFTLLRVKDGTAPVYAAKMQLASFEPASFNSSHWTYKQWNVLNGLKVNGAGSGYFEYTVPWPANLKKADIESVALLFEASAKELFVKDADELTNADGDFMRGGGTHNPCKNKNSYAMTDQTTFPSSVKVYVNKTVCGDQYLPDDPADHRGILSWHAQAKDKKLYEAGSYGYLVEMVIPISAINENQAIHIRLEVPEGINGGLAIYGKDFGRYPLDPTVVFYKR
jgi:hypothetical protein